MSAGTKRNALQPRQNRCGLPPPIFALGKEVVHIEGLNECNFELNKIGNNLKQLTLLCHQRRIDNPDLRSIHGRLCALLESISERMGEDSTDGDS